jgi:bacterioferritin-associated ferredoxin
MNSQFKTENDEIFNFVGECVLDNIPYLLKLSVNAQEIIHIVKFYTGNKNESFKKRVDAFIQFCEGRKISQVQEFFQTPSAHQNDIKTFAIDPLLYCWQVGLLDYTGDKILLKNKFNFKEVLCSCSGLSSSDLDKLKKSSFFSMETLVKETKAGTGCGACRADLKKILKTYEEFPNLTANSYLRLWQNTDIQQTEFLCRCKKVPLSEIAEVLEKHQETGNKLYLKLQTQYGIGINCTSCEDTVKNLLK